MSYSSGSFTLSAFRIGRLYVWAVPGWRPKFHLRTENGVWFIGVGYLAACYMGKPPAAPSHDQ